MFFKYSNIFQRQFVLEPFIEMLQPLPGPTEVLGKICDQFLNQNIASVVYITNSEKYGRSVLKLLFQFSNFQFHLILNVFEI